MKPDECVCGVLPHIFEIEDGLWGAWCPNNCTMVMADSRDMVVIDWNSLMEDHKKEHQESMVAIKKHESEGHTHHCACRLVWGDGECECGKVGKRPGPISRMIERFFYGR